jgi:hypothetical protein
MRTASVIAALIVLAGCSDEPAAPSATVTTTTTDRDKVTVEGIEIDRDDYDNRFGLEHKQWLDEVMTVRYDDEWQSFEMKTTLKRPRDRDTAIEMCEALLDMAKADGIEEPTIELYGYHDREVLMARATPERGCFPI